MSMNNPLEGCAEGLPATENDPILIHYREWVSALEEMYRLVHLEVNDEDPRMVECDRRAAVALSLIETTPPQSVEGIAALVHVVWDVCGPAHAAWSQDYADACEYPEHRWILTLWRAVTGKTTPPLFKGSEVRPPVGALIQEQHKSMDGDDE
jgi:hypothetical protein